MKIINEIKERYNIDTTTNSIGIYSEWAGANIQKGVGICNIDNNEFDPNNLSICDKIYISQEAINLVNAIPNQQ